MGTFLKRPREARITITITTITTKTTKMIITKKRRYRGQMRSLNGPGFHKKM